MAGGSETTYLTLDGDNRVGEQGQQIKSDNNSTVRGGIGVVILVICFLLGATVISIVIHFNKTSTSSGESAFLVLCI